MRRPGRLGRPPAGAGRSARRGDPKNGSKAIPRDRSSGRPGDRSIGTAEGCEIRGDSKLRRRQSRRCRKKGNRKPGSKALRGGSEENGAPRRITETGSAEGCEIRGNSKIHRWHSQTTEEAGQPVEAVTRRGQRTRSTGRPGDAQLAKPEDAGAGETRNQHERLNGTMHDPMSYQDTRRAPEAARSLAFSSHWPEPFFPRI